jgi:hypothetical protein
MKAVIDLIFVDLGFSKKGLKLLVLEKNSHSHIHGPNKAIYALFSPACYIF